MNTKISHEELLKIATSSSIEAGECLLSFFGKTITYKVKESVSSIVTEADTSSERLIRECIRKLRPHDALIGEEYGYLPGTSGYTWVIDPLDGTSNFAAGIPWFGVLIALFEGNTPLLGVAYLPTSGALYTGIHGMGAFLHNTPLQVSSARTLQEVLWGFGTDAPMNEDQQLRDAHLIGRIIRSVRNIRVTNSLVDEYLTAEGNLGGFLNLHMKVWDFAPWLVILREAGGVLYEVERSSFVISSLNPTLTSDSYDRSYGVLGGAPTLVNSFKELLVG